MNGSRAGRLFRGTINAVAFSLILAPVAIVVITAFSSADFFIFPPPGLSFRWFREFFHLQNMRDAFILSIQLAIASACLGTLLGLQAAIFVVGRTGVLASALQILFMAPLLFPTIILGFALLLFYRTVGMPIGPGLLLAHAIVGMPYCFRAILSGLQGLDTSIQEASQSLGAGPVRTLLFVVLPLIWPSVLSGWMFAFVVSFGELNTALFLTGPGVTTLPIEIFSYLQFQGSQLVIAAASTLQVGLIVLLMLVVVHIIGSHRLVRQ